ncbi:hypothetical protein [Vibrio ziniensis]|uniref:Uncharacterized protein n=1 Tax=Vibrio ziniensis TaxID=2711221 RepID=A0A6G7CHE7_9VIBR|nr:hypothetical protein [Vibrio ziniensis]QIH41458.1 hypothetical protein G5S32_05370 [Vibrio ziniensis]
MNLTPFCKDLTLKSNYPSYDNESPNLHVEVLDMPSHRFELNFMSRKLKNEEEHRAFWTMIESMKASVPFTWVPPKLSKILGTGGDALASETSAGGYEFGVYNAPSNTTWLKAGDLINIGNQTKVYRVMQDVVTNNAGVGTVLVNCPIKKKVPDGTAINGSGAVFTLIRKPGAKPQSFNLKGNTQFVSYADLEFIEFL